MYLLTNLREEWSFVLLYFLVIFYNSLYISKNILYSVSIIVIIHRLLYLP